ncbi:hypothetical protein AAHC63_03800, partial [Klebsiella quasipneumoniae subsp. quasipneumoniae]|uniref:hypothetical protein n=1 Tax=Klebsiella quasipneumoniae TaxID=1463165 RepID=UPI0039674398
LQNGNDLVFGESGFAHGDLLQEHNQYAGRSLNVNGPLYRDTYISTTPAPVRTITNVSSSLKADLMTSISCRS